MTGEHDSERLRMNISWKIISLVLLLVIAGMLALWRPWSSTDSGRTISVTGEAVISAEPDELVFYPYFEVADSGALATKATEITAKLKELGVEEKNIKTDASSYDRYYIAEPEGEKTTLQLVISITNNKDLSQKVQDYLLTVDAKGQITPQTGFSEAKRKTLEDEARSKATADARAKAEKSASELDTKVGKVKSVSEGSGIDIYPMGAEMARDTATTSNGSSASLPIQPGENEFTYQVQVEFYLK